MFLKNLIKKAVLYLTWILSGSLLLSCLAYYYPLFPLFDALSIGVPWLMAGNLVLAFLWSLKKRWILLPPLAALLVAFYSFGSIYEVEGMKDAAKGVGLQVLTFNTRGFSERSIFNPGTRGNQIVGFVADSDPDILCFQEFSRGRLRDFKQFPFRYITPHTNAKSTQAILSKYPILNQGQVDFPGSGNNTLFADIQYKGDTLRIYNIHLQSYQYRGRRFLIRNFGLDFVNRLWSVSRKHREQALLVRQHLEASPHPSVICGDFNATPFSHTYRILKSGKQDSFREKGTGWGPSFYLSGLIPFRIDYILADDHFEVLEHRNFDVRFSDHLPVMAILKPRGE
ncbi:MAG: endonuclease/exonuclease/phosphatase family protein [Robiginitalea sp.]